MRTLGGARSILLSGSDLFMVDWQVTRPPELLFVMVFRRFLEVFLSSHLNFMSFAA